ncbi:sugar transporter [Niveomyces insectorum RCEF 264]|uniref:Sugar transporter n=1 Tax=Niveomyces insectorum RCEF 264 TaxID=1081102 RepID=A0A168AB62_9HYPO|nr:sugar transporter [Niveomyces insectorum RCEF 264]
MGPPLLWSALASRIAHFRAYPPASVTDYDGVLVSLEEAHLYSHAARMGRRSEYEHVAGDEDEDEEVVDAVAEPPAEEDEDVENGERRKSGPLTAENGTDDDDDEDASAATAVLPMRACEYSIEGLRRAVRQGDSKDGRRSWTDYESIQDIGMGRYNWQLFFLCGFGWFADNLWMQGVSLILPSLSAEFGIAEKTVRYTTSALFFGLCFGSFFWGIGSDVLGRRLAFNCTLLITSIFGFLAAYAGSWGGVCALVAALGFGVGGNLPVDGALFLEFLPDASSSLLTLLSVWWPVGQLCSSLLAWMQISGDAARDAESSSSSSSSQPVQTGWRRFVATIGLLTFAMFVVRFFVFRLFESPKYLLSRGRQAEAVAVIHGLAHRNGTKTWLTEAVMDAVAEGSENTTRRTGYRATDVDDGDDYDRIDDNETIAFRHRAHGHGAVASVQRPPATSLVRDRLKAFSGERLRPLFRSRQLGMATLIVWFVWATIGMGYPLFNAFLPQYLSHGGSSTAAGAAAAATARAEAETPPTSVTYRNYAITSIVGVPGSLLAAYTVDNQSPFLGRRGTLAISTLVSAVFLVLFATFGHSPGSQLFFSCIEAFSQNIMYGVLYAFTPEIFPAPVRGAGTGVASFLNRVTGLVAPVLAATLPGDGSTAPIYLSAALILSAFFGMILIPIETRGRQRL